MKQWHWVVIIIIVLLIIYFVMTPKKLGNYKYFSLSEFDSPDQSGSGVNMDPRFMKMLDQTREIAGIPFYVSSGYRTPEHNKAVKGVDSSAHTTGKAADIKAPFEWMRTKIAKAAVQAGFKRIGIGSTFVHLDSDETKPQMAYWGYPSGTQADAPFNPFQLT